MTDQAVVVVDFGTSTSSAAVVSGSGIRLVKEPTTGDWSWPSSVYFDGETLVVGTAAEQLKRDDPSAYRTEFKPHLGEREPIRLGAKGFQPEQLVTALLVAFREQVEIILGGRTERLVLTVPAAYGMADPRRDLMITAGERAGFSEVELLPEPVAAAFAPVAGSAPADGSVVLVYDFGGGTFDAALVRIAATGDHGVLGHAALADCGGRDVDALVRRFIQEQGGPTFAALAGDRDDLSAWHVQVELVEFARRAKHQLTDMTSTRAFFLARERVNLERTQLTELVQPLVDRTIRCCLDLLTSAGIALEDLGAVLLVGGSSRLPVVSHALSTRLGRPLRRAEDLSTAVVQGAAEWAKGAKRRSGPPGAAVPGERPLRWDLPGGTGRVVRWLVAPGDTFDAGAPLGVVRLSDGTLWWLSADDRGGMLGHIHAAVGSFITSHDWLASITADLARHLVIEHFASADRLAFSPDGRLLTVVGHSMGATYDTANGERVRSFATGHPVAHLAFSPDGRLWAVSVVGQTVEVLEIGGESPVWSVDYGAPVRAVELSSNGRSLAVGCEDGLVQILDPINRRAVIALQHQWAWPLAFSADSRRLAAGGDTTTRIWDTATGGVLIDVPQENPVGTMAFSPDGRWLCTAGIRHSSVIISTATARTRMQIHHESAMHAVLFSPDGTRLSTLCGDGAVRIWDTTNGAEAASIVNESPARCIAMSPDGRLACGHDSGVLRVTRIP